MSSSRIVAGPERRRSAVFPVLGVPVRFEAHSAATLDAVEAVFGAWRALHDRSRLISGAEELPPRIRLLPFRPATDAPSPSAGVDAPPDAAEIRGAPLNVRVHGFRLVLRTPGAAGAVNFRRMEATCRLAPWIFGHGERLREVLNTLTLSLVTRRDRQPVHAAAVARSGRALVLAGPSGTGKSTLAYAALRAGLRVLDDDTVYVQLKPRFRVWGKADRLHLAPGAATLFPELAGRPSTLRSNGKRKIAVELLRSEVSDAPPAVDRAGLVLLERGPGPVTVDAVAVDDAVTPIVRGLAPGFDAFRDTIESRLRALAAGGAWRLRLSDDPEEAVARLDPLLARISA